MKRCILVVLVISGLAGCAGPPHDRGQQYRDGEFSQAVEAVNRINTPGKPINLNDFFQQIDAVATVSPNLYNSHRGVYQALAAWMKSGANIANLTQFGLSPAQMAGMDNLGNVLLTGYYTPVMQARYQPDEEFRYPLYRLPEQNGAQLPSRSDIYAGALQAKGLELAYSRSLMDNFIMAVQGSGYLDFNDNQPLAFFGYSGKNNHPYRSIGRILVERGEIPKEKISMQAIRRWAEQQSEQSVLELLTQNQSFVFYQPQGNVPVIGASGIPLIAKASVAADRNLIKLGTALLVEYPLLDNKGRFRGKYELRLMLALDVGGAIKGQHLDVYQGIGDEAGHAAGFYNHFGRVWLITAPNGGAAASPVQ